MPAHDSRASASRAQLVYRQHAIAVGVPRVEERVGVAAKVCDTCEFVARDLAVAILVELVEPRAAVWAVTGAATPASAGDAVRAVPSVAAGTELGWAQRSVRIGILPPKRSFRRTAAVRHGQELFQRHR